MLQIIAFGVAFVLFGIGVIAKHLKIISLPADKRTKDAGDGERLFFIALGILILGLSLLQGVAFM